MTTGLTYNTYVEQICTMAVLQWAIDGSGVAYPVDYPSDPQNVTLNPSQVMFPQMITYAENRIYRDLDFLFTQTVRNYACTIGDNILAVPTTDFITIQTLSINSSGTAYTPLLATTKEFIRNVYGDPTAAGLPQYFAMYGGDLATYGQTSNNIELGPYPDQAYAVRVTGTVRPSSLSSSNTTTFVSTYLPDLMIMASMIYVSAYQRNFGRANDDPQMAQSYETQYKELLKASYIEEARKKFQAGAWTAYSPAQAASPTR